MNYPQIFDCKTQDNILYQAPHNGFQFIGASSHDWNGGFKNKIKQVFKEKSGRFQTPVVISKSSLKMSYNMARKILKDVQAQSPNPQVHVIMLGDNNLRWSHSQPEDVLAMF